jgi:uncharacterized protein (DUF1800 family)
LSQLNGGEALPELLRPFPTAATTLRVLPPLRMGLGDELREKYRMEFINEMGARFATGFRTETPLRERLVWFWANHFTVAITKGPLFAFAGSYEREAIRPHVLGRFVDMLIGVVRHPGMQLYLDQAQSIGPNSRAGNYAGLGLNENLAREVLELHTIGVEAGYTQDDVVALAKILTGWSLTRGDDVEGDDAFRFFPNRHEPGEKILLGKKYGEGYDEGVRALTDLSKHPATATRVATKFARHFIADEPPQSSIDRLAAVFRDTDGDLKALAEAVIEDDACWQAGQNKMRAPVEYVTAAVRAIAGQSEQPLREQALRGLMQATRLMGQFPFGAPSPKGWPDDAKSWAGPDAMLERVEWAHALASRIPTRIDPVALASDVLGPLVTQPTLDAVSRAETPVQGLALLLSSPEFQKR